MPKISKHTRATAIRIAALAASSGPPGLDGSYRSDAGNLYGEAHDAVCSVFALSPIEQYQPWLRAEAECLLREGWCPGEPVRRL